MADIVKALEGNKKVMYKFGQNDIDLNKYIHNLGTNVLNYMNSKNWNEGLRGEFMLAYERYLAGLKDLSTNNTNRFSTNNFGSIIDSTGEFSNKDIDDIDPVGSEYYYDDKGNRITTDDYNMLKLRKLKNYNTFSANREIASYFNAVGNALREATPSESAKQNKFNLQKSGFLANFNKTYSPTGEAIDPSLFWDKDTVDSATGKRGTTNRAKFLQEQIDSYANSLGEHDFTESPFKDRETYLARLKAASNSLANGYNSESALALNLAGIGGEFLKNFFSSGETALLELSPLELEYKKSEEERLKKEYEQLLSDTIYNNKRDEFFKNYVLTNPFKSTITASAVPLSYGRSGMLNYVLSKNKDVDINNDEAVADVVKTYINFPELALYIRGNKKLMSGLEDITSRHIANNLDFAANTNLFTTPVGNTGYYVIPGSENYDNWSYMAYNPKLRKYEELSMLLNDELKLKMAYAQYDKLNKLVPKNQLGGTFTDLKKLREKANKQSQIKKLAEDTGRDPNKAVAGSRKIGTITNPTGEWTAVDKVRLGAAAADIGSLIAAYVPGYGTVASAGLGLGSTIANFGADMTDESTTGWDVARNVGVGLASDVMGLIPGIGSAGKVGKIAKTLKYILPTAIAGWSTYLNGGQYILAANKLMSDPSKMTVDDWRSLGEGLLVTMGLGKMHAGNRQAKKYANKNITTEQFNTLRSKSGKDLKFSPEKAKQIQSAKGYKELNKAFLAEYPGESLGGEFNKWKPWRNPKVGKGVDYGRSEIDYSLSERIPWGYSNKNGKVTPNKLSNDWILEKLSNIGVWNGPNFKNFGTKKNPLYNKAPIVQTARTNSLLSRKRFDTAVEKGIKNKEQIQTIEYWKKRYPKRLANKSDLEILSIIDTLRLASKKERGGTINLQSVRKFLTAGKITNTTSVANWFGDMFSSDSMKSWLGTFNKDNYNDFNNLLKSWSTNLKATLFVPGATPVNYNQGVFDRQGLWESTGTNKTIEDLATRGIIKRPGVSGDNSAGKHLDGYFGNLEYLRHGGTKESWEGKDSELKAFLELLAEKGLNYLLDELSGMYLLSPIQSTAEVITLPTVHSAATDPTSEEKKLPVSTSKSGVLSGIFNNPTVMYGLPRAMYADKMNRKMTDLAKDSITPLLKDPMQISRITRGDLDAEMRGVKTYANLRNMASKPISSDANIQQAMQLEAELKGLEAINAGKTLSNYVQRQYDEMAWKQEKENLNNRHETAMFNRALAWAADLNKSKIEQAYLSKKHNIWDVLGQLVEMEARTKQLENKSRVDTFAASDIHNAVQGDPNLYGVDLTNDELVLWDKLQSGISPSTFSDEERRKLSLIYLKISIAEQNLLRDYYGIPLTKWSDSPKKLPEANITISENGGVLSAKRGSKIALAGIEAKTANAERFQKQIKETIDRNEKALERLSKSLNGIIKSSTIK